MFMTTNKTFEAGKPEVQQPYQSHDLMIRPADKTFIKDVLMIEWPEAEFIRTNNQRRINE
jgi:hypothetical protein